MSMRKSNCYVCGDINHSHGLCSKCLHRAKKINLFGKSKVEVISGLNSYYENEKKEKEEKVKRKETKIVKKVIKKVIKSRKVKYCYVCEEHKVVSHDLCSKCLYRAKKNNLLNKSKSEIYMGLGDVYKKEMEKEKTKKENIETLKGLTGNICYICGDINYSRGLCKRCYQKARRKGILDDNKVEIIKSIESSPKVNNGRSCYICGKPYNAKGLCNNCYNKAKKYGLKDKEEIIKKFDSLKEKNEKTCYICGKPHSTKGLCDNHYIMARRYKIIDKTEEEIKDFILALIDSRHKNCYYCGKPHDVKGLCNKHYHIAKKLNLIDESKEVVEKELDAYYKKVEAVREVRKNQKCYVCGSEIWGHGLCTRCLYRAKRIKVLGRGKEEIVKAINDYNKK